MNISSQLLCETAMLDRSFPPLLTDGVRQGFLLRLRQDRRYLFKS
jgi:hypothetical protein